MLKLSVKNGKEVKTDLVRLAGEWDKNTHKVIRRGLLPDFDRVERNLFKTTGGSGAHGKWPKLTKPYAKWKRSKYPWKIYL